MNDDVVQMITHAKTAESGSLNESFNDVFAEDAAN